MLNGTARPDSDIDLLVEFEPGKAPGLLELAGMEIALSPRLGGRRVDMRTPEDLSRYFEQAARNVTSLTSSGNPRVTAGAARAQRAKRCAARA